MVKSTKRSQTAELHITILQRRLQTLPRARVIWQESKRPTLRFHDGFSLQVHCTGKAVSEEGKKIKWFGQGEGNQMKVLFQLS